MSKPEKALWRKSDIQVTQDKPASLKKE